MNGVRSRCEDECAGGSVPNGLHSACQVCSPGSHAAVGGLEVCTPCAAGEFQDGSGATACKACPVGSYASAPAASTCASCPADRTTRAPGSSHAWECVCSGGTMSLSVATASLPACQLCPLGADCSEPGLVPRALPGSWYDVAAGLLPGQPLRMVLCQPAEACAGGRWWRAT